MTIEIKKDGIVIPPSLVYDDYDFMETLEELKTTFKPLVMNYKVVKYFGIDLVWQTIQYR